MPIVKEETQFTYPQSLPRVELHQDKFASHTSISTTVFLENMKSDMCIKSIPFAHIPAKSPVVSPMDYCAF